MPHRAGSPALWSILVVTVVVAISVPVLVHGTPGAISSPAAESVVVRPQSPAVGGACAIGCLEPDPDLTVGTSTHVTSPTLGRSSEPYEEPSGTAVQPSVQPEATITLSAAGVTPAAISLSWTATTDFLFSNYTIAYSNQSASGPFVPVGVVTSQSTTQFVLGSLSPGATYWWQVTEEARRGVGATSNVLQVQQRTLAYLTAPTNTTTSITFGWTDNATYGGLLSFTEFVLFEKNTSTGPFRPVANVSNETVHSVTVGGLTSGASYSFYLNTTDCLSCGSRGSTSSATTSNTLTTGPPFPLLASVAAYRTVVDMGESDLLSCTPSGGVSPFTFAWELNSSVFVPGNSTLAHSFPAPGSEPVHCKITDHALNLAVGGTTITVFTDPTVTPGVNRTTADVDEPISFACTASGGVAPLLLSWNFGDGLGQMGGLAAHAYASAGTFVPSCLATDGAGVTVAQSMTVTVSPSLEVTATDSSAAAAPGTKLNFTATASNGSGTYSSFTWQFGDGTTATGPSAGHAYSSQGNYTVTVRVIDSNGIPAVASTTVRVTPVQVREAVAPTGGTVGSAVTLSASASGGAGGPYNYTWDFGDGTVGYGAQVNHSYSSVGSFTPTVTVRDRLGAEDASIWPAIVVSPAPGPLAWLADWVLAVIGAAIGAILAFVIFARLRRSDRTGLVALSRWVPPAGPMEVVSSSMVCSACGASNPPKRRSCQVCGAALSRIPSR
jgi:hypothetical protein